MKRVYLASPLGFSDTTIPFLDAIKEILAEVDIEILDPWERDEETTIALEEAELEEDPEKKIEYFRNINTRIAAGNVELIRESDFLLAILDGPDIDSGTAAEIGYAYATGKRIYGFRSDLRRSGENAGAVLNSQVEFFLRESGGTIFFNLDSLRDGLATIEIPPPDKN